jgi:hypothetical protein
MFKRILIVLFFIVINLFSQEIPSGEEQIKENVEKIENGNLLYRDVQTYVAPGQYFLVKSINNYLSENSYNLIITILFVFSISLIFRKSYQNNSNKNKHTILIYFGILFSTGLLIYKFSDISSALLSSFLIVLINTIVIFRYYETKQLKYLIVGGILLGIAGVFRHDVLSYLYGAEFWGIFFFGIKLYSDKEDKWIRKFLSGMKYGIIFTFGILIIILPVFVLIYLNTDSSSLYYQLVEFPLFEYKDYFAIPLPNPFSFISIVDTFQSIWFYIPLLVFVITAIKLYINSKSKKLTSDSLKFWKIIFLFNLGINSYNQALIVSDTYHLLPALIVGAILINYITDDIKFKNLFIYLYIFMFLILGIM